MRDTKTASLAMIDCGRVVVIVMHSSKEKSSSGVDSVGGIEKVATVREMVPLVVQVKFNATSIPLLSTIIMEETLFPRWILNIQESPS